MYLLKAGSCSVIRLILNSLCSTHWPGTGDPPALTQQVLGLQVPPTALLICGYELGTLNRWMKILFYRKTSLRGKLISLDDYFKRNNEREKTILCIIWCIYGRNTEKGTASQKMTDWVWDMGIWSRWTGMHGAEDVEWLIKVPAQK